MEKSNPENFEITKLDLKNVFISSYDIYKRGFKQYITLSLIYFIFFVISSIFGFIANSIKTDEGLLTLGFIEFVFFIAMFFVITRIAISFYLLTEKIISNKEFSAKGVYREAKGFFWRFIWKSILYSLFVSIPIFIAFSAYDNLSNDILKYFIIVILLVFLVIVAVKYFFVPICAVLEDRSEKCFAKSEKVVSGDVLRILVLMIVFIIPVVPYQIYIRVINNINEMSEVHLFLIGLLNQSMSLFLTPFISIVTVTAYFMLKRNKKIG